MNLTASRSGYHLFWWIAGAMLLLSFGLADTAIVVLAASLATIQQVAACALAFGMICIGALFTLWQMRQRR